MKKLNYILIPLIVLTVDIAGGWLTNIGMGWYKNLNLPEWTPPGGTIGIVWTVIFILTAVSILIFWNKSERNRKFRWITGLFIANAVLNVAWSWIFFVRHQMLFAVIDSALICVSVLLIILYMRSSAKSQGKQLLYFAYMLLLPYLAWTAFATYLTYAVWSLNK